MAVIGASSEKAHASASAAEITVFMPIILWACPKPLVFHVCDATLVNLGDAGQSANVFVVLLRAILDIANLVSH